MLVHNTQLTIKKKNEGWVKTEENSPSTEPWPYIKTYFKHIAASVIGGADLMGGEGNLLGTFMGALVMGILRNGLNLLNVSTYWQQVVIGSVIALTVAIGTFKKK